jgi:hypothetical protein
VPKLLTSDQQRHYARDGIAFPIRVLSPSEAGVFRAACDDLESRLGGKPRTVEVRQMHLHLPWAHRLATHLRIVDAVEDLLGPDLLIWATELFAKHPHDAAVSIAWHRDRTYMRFASPTTVTAWVALSDSMTANGCMRAVREPRRQTSAVTGGDEVGLDTVDVVLAAGEMSLHDSDILHGSGPNRSAAKRVGFAIRFITPEARPPHGRPPAVLARGRCRTDRFQLIDPPTDTDVDQTLARMKQSALLHFEAILENLKPATR